MTVRGKGDEVDKDLKVVHNKDNQFEVTDLSSGESKVIDCTDFDFEYNSLIRMNVDKSAETLQFLGQTNNLDY